MATFTSFDNEAIRLIRDECIPVTDLVRRLREMAIEASRDMKTIHVKYCAIHGGFGYSDTYKEWWNLQKPKLKLEKNLKTRNYRTDDQDAHETMKRFALDIFKRCPELEKTLIAYHVWDAPLALRIVRERESRVQKKEDVIHRIKYIQTLIETRKMTMLDAIEDTNILTKIPNIRIDKTFMNCSHCYFDIFDLLCLEEFERTGVLILQTIEDGAYDSSMLKMVRHPKVLELAVRFLQKQRDEESKKNDYCTKNASFVDHMLKTGNIDWKRQFVLHVNDAKFAEFLAMTYPIDVIGWDELESIDYSPGWFENDDMRNVQPLEMMGRMLASGRYCRLAISDVPALADWKIGEYDGLECVTWI